MDEGFSLKLKSWNGKELHGIKSALRVYIRVITRLFLGNLIWSNKT